MLAYFMNSYPMTSTTFIRREIEEIERLGRPVLRFAIRRWGQPLVDDADRAEAGRTLYLLDDKIGVARALLAETAANPRGMLRALRAWLGLVAAAGGGLGRHLAYLAEAAALKRRAAAAGVTHLHTHFTTNSAAVAMLAHLMGGPRFSVTAHGPNEFFDFAAASVGEKVRRASFVAAISHFCRMQLLLAAGMQAGDRIHVVRCGVDLDDFAPTGRPPAPDAPFVCVGRLCLEKAQTLIPPAVAAVLARRPDLAPRLRVVLIGDGETRGDIEQAIAAHGLGDVITLSGWRSNAEVRTALADSRALLLPSFAEGLPVVIMEALALARPVITTFIAGVPELVDRSCGWLTPASDVEALSDAIEAAMDATPETLVAMGAAGRSRVARMHDRRPLARRLLALIDAAATPPETVS